MSSFLLKVIAFSLMLVDHIGFVFFPDRLEFRVIGRLSFPIFAFLSVQGFFNSRNIFNYVSRLLVFGVLTQSFYYDVFGFDRLNILFVLAFGIILIYFFDSCQLWKFAFFCFVFGFLAGVRLIEYQLYGLFTMIYFYFLAKNNNVLSLKLFLFYLVFQVWGIWELDSLIQPVSVLSLLIIDLYNGNRGLNTYYLFYCLYPFHLIVLSFLRS